MARRPRISIRFVLPKEIQDGFPDLLDKVQKHIVRQSIRSAIIPARNALKAKYIGLLASSRQSSGATLRSITTKVRNVNTAPFVFYGIVGVNRKVIEYFDPTRKSPEFPDAMMRQVNFGVKARIVNGVQTFTRSQPRREVKSGLRRRYGVTNMQKRIRKPNKYLHLTEYGFNGPGDRSFSGHRFVTKSKQETETQAQTIFTEKVFYHFRRAFGR